MRDTLRHATPARRKHRRAQDRAVGRRRRGYRALAEAVGARSPIKMFFNGRALARRHRPYPGAASPSAYRENWIHMHTWIHFAVRPINLSAALRPRRCYCPRARASRYFSGTREYIRALMKSRPWASSHLSFRTSFPITPRRRRRPGESRQVDGDAAVCGYRDSINTNSRVLLETFKTATYVNFRACRLAAISRREDA